MNSLVEQGYIEQMSCGSNFSYILNDSGAFLPTEYKVLQSQGNSCFVKCMKMTYNGSPQLYYLTSGLKPLSVLLPTMDPESFLTIVSNLFADIIDVKHNGFLSCQNIDISFERIYVDPATLKVQLVYLPLSRRMFLDTATFETELRTGLIKLISALSQLTSSKTSQFSADLANGTLSLEELWERAKEVPEEEPVVEEAPPVAETAVLRMTAINAPGKFALVLDKDIYTIGNGAGHIDGSIPYDKLVSRIHCRITRKGTRFSVIDLKSANGTFVNNVRLRPNQPCLLQDGDLLRLATSDFVISIK